MRTIASEQPPEPIWVDLPDGGRLQFRRPTWEDRDRAATRAANATEGKQDITDITRELMLGLLVGQEEFGHPDGREVDLSEDAPGIVRSLSIADVRACEAVLYPPVTEAGDDLGN